MTLQKKLQLVLGRICWGVSAGHPNGSDIFLHFGEKIQLSKPLPNNKLKYGLNKYTGEYMIGIFCDWRLQKNGVPITGSCEPNMKDGPLVKGLENIVDKKVTHVELSDECGDIDISFNDICLKVFCNYTGNEDEKYCFQDETNWELFHRDKILIEVQRGCKIIIH